MTAVRQLKPRDPLPSLDALQQLFEVRDTRAGRGLFACQPIARGTPLFSEAEARPHLIFVRVGSFDDPDLANPAMSIWTSSAPHWACIDAGLPKVDKQPPPAA